MKKIDSLLKIFTLSLMAFGAFTFTSCGSDDPDPIVEVVATETIAELIESTDGLDSLRKYIAVYPDLVGLLGAPGNNTFFAPDNNAFVSLLQTPGFPQEITSISPDIIKAVLAYHIVAGQTLMAADLTAGLEIGTLYTDPATQVNQVIEVNDDGTLFTGATNDAIEVKTADIKATNGVMHVTKSVLIPPSIGSSLTALLGTISGAVMLSADFTILAGGFQKAEAYAATTEGKSSLLATLAGGTHTFFAPSNATFDAAGLTAASFDGATWHAIISHHAVASVIAQADMTTGTEYTTLLGAKLGVFNNTAVVPAKNGVGIYLDSNGDVDLTLADGGASLANLNAEVALFNATPVSNGAFHVIAGVLNPN